MNETNDQPFAASDDLASLRAQVQALQQERDTLSRKLVQREREIQDGGDERDNLRDQLEAAAAEIAQLRSTLGEVMAHFGAEQSIRDITPEEAASARSCPMLTTPKVTDVYRWLAALTSAPEGTRP